MKEYIWISIQIALFHKFVSKGQIIKIPALVQIMNWRRREAIVWTNAGKFTDIHMRHMASISK